VDWSSSFRSRVLVLRGTKLRELPTTILATVLLGVTTVSLRRGGFRSASSQVRCWSSMRAPTRTSHPQDAIDRVLHSVNGATALLPAHVDCLQKSLVTRALLQRVGIEAILRIGVRREISGLAAHAWVEFEGAVVNDSAEVVSQFVPFDEPVTPTVVAAMRR
jgi:hypothetical protein